MRLERHWFFAGVLGLSICGLCSCSSDEVADIDAKNAPTTDRKAASKTEMPVEKLADSSEKFPSLFAKAAEELGDDWQPVGPGGGGHQEFPAISPHDPNVMFVACDMSGFYRTDNAGQSWHMDDQVSRVSHPPVFHPTDPNVIYVCTRHAINEVMTVRCGWSFWMSEDKGVTWSKVFTHDYEAYANNEVSSLQLDPLDPSHMWISFLHTGDFLTSRDAGQSWEPAAPPKADGDEGKAQTGKTTLGGTARLVLGRLRDGTRTMFRLSNHGVYRTRDEGLTWQDVSPSDSPVIDLNSGATQDAGEETAILFAIGKANGTGPETTNAIWRSTDGGESWQDMSQQFLASVDPDGRIISMRRVESCGRTPSTLYISADVRNGRDHWYHGAFKSTDGGDSWQFLMPTPAMNDEFRQRHSEAEFEHFEPGWVPLEFTWWWGGNAMHFAVSPTDPDRLLWTDMGRTLATFDGGKTWRNLYCNRGELEHYSSRGLEVTGGFRVVFDPHHDGRMWIAYNDIGNWRSDDGGLTWRYAMRGAKHRLSMYELAVDPDIPGRLYGASSNVHDLPRWRYIVRDPKGYTGGFVITNDGGLTWTTQGEGLPEAACTGLVLDPTSDQDNRTLYVVAFGHGVYKSEDSGRTWTRKVSGMESYLELNENVFSISRGMDGTLYAAITKRVRFSPGKPRDSRAGAVFISEDGAESWQRIGPQLPEEPSRKKNDFSFVWDVVASPHDPDEVLVACAMDVHSHTNAPGGVYRSKDRGKTWKRIFKHARCCRVDYHPTDPNVLFCGGDDGLHWSLDQGETWQPAEGLPFKAEISRANVAPNDPDRIWVTTWGGGVWTGKFRK